MSSIKEDQVKPPLPPPLLPPSPFFPSESPALTIHMKSSTSILTTATVILATFVFLLPSSVAFGPALNADPGAGEPFSSPESEFDNQAGVECPNPPCRQLKKDLETRRDHDIEIEKRHRAELSGASHHFEDKQVEYPPKINLIIGGNDCKVCNEVLMGEGLNPMDLHKMRDLVPGWEARTNKLIEAKPSDIELKKHAITASHCIHAFDRSICSVDLEKSDSFNRVLRGNR